MQLFFHLVYLPILYGKAKSAKRRKKQQQKQTGKQKKLREREIAQDIFVAITCRKVIKKALNIIMHANILKDHANKLMPASY